MENNVTEKKTVTKYVNAYIIEKECADRPGVYMQFGEPFYGRGILSALSSDDLAAVAEWLTLSSKSGDKYRAVCVVRMPVEVEA